MQIIFDATRTVKPARPFAAGVLTPSRPSAADLAWWAAESAAMEAARLEDERFDRLAEESAFLDRYERGLSH